MALLLPWEAVQPMDLDCDLHVDSMDDMVDLLENDQFMQFLGLNPIQVAEKSTMSNKPDEESTSDDLSSLHESDDNLDDLSLEPDRESAQGPYPDTDLGQGDAGSAQSTKPPEVSPSLASVSGSKPSKRTARDVSPPDSTTSDQDDLACDTVLPLESEAVRREIARLFKEKYPTVDNPASHNLPRQQLNSKLPNRDTYTINKGIVDLIVRKKFNGVLPSVFSESFRIYDWDCQKHSFIGKSRSLESMQCTEQGSYSACVPLKFDRASALSANFCTMNVLYNNKTYCSLCRHQSIMHDMHPWCWRCYIVSGYQPCHGVGLYSCHWCRKMPAKARKARDKQVKGANKASYKAVVNAIGGNHLNSRIIYQYDALLCMTVALNYCGDPAIWEDEDLKVIAEMYDLTAPLAPVKTESTCSPAKQRKVGQTQSASAGDSSRTFRRSNRSQTLTEAALRTRFGSESGDSSQFVDENFTMYMGRAPPRDEQVSKPPHVFTVENVHPILFAQGTNEP